MPKKDENKKIAQSKPLGGSGTTIYAGVFDQEYKSTLSTEFGSGGLKIYERMRKSDPVVGASLSIIKLALLQGEWFVEPASDDSADKEIAEFLEDALLKRMDRTFPEVLSDALTSLDFGFHVAEKVFKVEDGKVWWKDFAYRAQTSITRFQTKRVDWEAMGKEGVTQFIMGDVAEELQRTELSIPKDRIIVFTNAKEGDNWRGVSLLRRAYKPWFFKENTEKIDAMGFEREAMGVPTFKMPEGTINDKDVETAEELGKNVRANEKAFIILPPGWDLDFKYPTGTRRDADVSIRRYNRDIFYNVLAQFLDLGSTSSGSRSLSEDHTDVFFRSLQSVGDAIARDINTQAIPQLVDLNFDNVTEYPKLKVTGVRKLNEDKFSSALQRLTMANILVPDDDLEDFVRDSLKLPERGKGSREMGTAEEKPKPGGKDPKDPKKPKDKKKFREVDSKFLFFKPWRPLTFAEEVVNFDSLVRNMDRMEGTLSSDLPRMLQPAMDKLLDDATKALEMGNPKLVDDLLVPFRDDVFRAVMETLKESFELGKITASNELEVLAPKTSVEDVNALTAQAKAMTDKIVDDLRNTARLNVLNNINIQTPVDAAIASLQQALADQLAISIELTASVATVGGINKGRDTVFSDNAENIHGLQRSELLDRRTCNFCISMDGRIVELADPIAKHGVFHFRCRGIWVAISKEEAELPDITGVPGSLRSRIGTLTEFKQIPTPRPLEGSLAEDFVNKEE